MVPTEATADGLKFTSATDRAQDRQRAVCRIGDPGREIRAAADAGRVVGRFPGSASTLTAQRGRPAARTKPKSWSAICHAATRRRATGWPLRLLP